MATKAAQVEASLAGYVDLSGVVLQNGKIYTYEAGTTTPKTTWQDIDKTTPHANPIILSDVGTKSIYADGLYKFVIKDSDDNLIYTLDNLQYFYISETISIATEISAADSTGITFIDDGGNTGIKLNDGGNVGIKLDTNPQCALSVADSDSTSYATSIATTPNGSDIIRVRNIHSGANYSSIQLETGLTNSASVRLIAIKNSSDESSFAIQLEDGSSPGTTVEKFLFSSEGDLTVSNSIVINNITISGNTISTTSSNLNLTPVAGSSVIIDSHFSFDGSTLTAITDNNTVINAYTGKNVTIESVSIDGGVVTGVTNLTMSGVLSGVTNLTMSGNLAIGGSLSISYDVSNYLLTTLSSTGVLDLSLTGTSTAFFLSGGNVGIGSTSITSLGTDIVTLAVSGKATGKTGGIYLDSSDASVKFVMYGNTSDSATLPFAIGTTTNHGLRFLINNSAIGAINQSGYLGLGTTSQDTRIHVEGTTDAGACIKVRGSSGVTGKVRVQTDGSIFYVEAVSGGGLNFVQDGISQRATFDTSGNFGVGTSTVSARIHAISTTEQIRWGYDASNYGKTTVSSVGLVTFDAAGSGAGFNFSKNVTINGVSASTTPPFKIFTYNINSSITSYAATEALQLISYQRDAGSPYTKRSAIIANADGTVPSELEIWTKGSGDSSPTNRILVTSAGNVGIGTSTVSARIHAISTTEQIRFGYDSSNYASLTTSSTGETTLNITGSDEHFIVTDVVTITNQHKCLLYDVETVTISTGTTTGVHWVAESYDTGGLHSTSSNKDRITAVKSGIYIFTAQICFTADATGYREVTITANGSQIARTRSQGSSSFASYLNCSASVYLNAGEYAYVSVYQNSGGNLDIIDTAGAQNSYFSCVKVA